MHEKKNRPARNRAAQISWGDSNHYTGPALPAITVTAYQRCEIRAFLAAHDPAYLRELEAAE